MNTSTWSPLMKLLVTGGALYLAYKHGPAEVKGMALGAAGWMLLQQIPVINAGAHVQLLAAA